MYICGADPNDEEDSTQGEDDIIEYRQTLVRALDIERANFLAMSYR